MRYIHNIFLAVALLALPTIATAGAGDKHLVGPDRSAVTSGLSAVALDGAAGTRTFTFNPVGYARVIFYVDYTHSNDGTLTLTCTASDDGNTTDFALTTCTEASGTCTLNFAGVIVTPSLTTDKDFVAVLGVHSYRSVECVLEHGGTPDSADVATITYDLTTD